MGRTVPPADWTPDLPHPDPRREAFAHRVARGESGAEAYRQTAAKAVTMGTAKSNALRMRREPAVEARISAIKAERASIEADVDDLTAADLGALMAECTRALEAALDAADRTGASPVQLSKLRRALTVHANRVTKNLEEQQPEESRQAAAFEVPELHRCTCNA